MSSYVKIASGKCTYIFDPPAFRFTPESDDFQKNAFSAIEKNENVIVTAHTGSGKTRVGLYAIAHFAKLGKKVVYTTPVKALSNQKYKELVEFSEKLYEQTGMQISVGIMTGDIKINPTADVIVMTTEIIRNALFKINNKKMEESRDITDSTLDKIGCVIFDEVHYINDKDRGHVWEETMCLLDPSILMVMLSATISKVEEFASWIGNMKKKIVNVVTTNKRVVPLNHYIYVDDKLYHYLDNSNNFFDKTTDIARNEHMITLKNKKNKFSNNLDLLNEMVLYLQKNNLLQTIFFSFSRRNCQKYAESIKANLLDYKEVKEVNDVFRFYMHKYQKDYEMTKQFQIIKTMINKGVCFHHGGLIPILKEIIEIIFRKGLIKVLFATETFAVGVNNPTRTIIFTEIQKPTKYGKRLLETSEYRQMAGRAGRRGIDKIGTVILLPLYNFPSNTELKQIILGSIPHIQSKFNINYNFLLKIILSTSSNLSDFIHSSLSNQDDQKVFDKTKKELCALKIECEKHQFKPDPNIDSYLKILDEEAHMEKLGLRLPNKKIKKNKKIKLLFEKDKGLIESIEKYKMNYATYQKIIKYTEYLDTFDQRIQNFSLKYIQYLQEMGYIDSVKKSPYEFNHEDITAKGFLASQINECNLFILTEIIINKLLHNLSPCEIVSFLSVFVTDLKLKHDYTLDEIYGTDHVISQIKKVNDIISRYKQAEMKYGIISEDNFWDISYNFVDGSYSWALGDDLKTVFEYCDIFEGDFVKSMLKISNLVKDVKILSNIYGDLTIAPVLDEVNELILRGIVNINSLYVNA